jgi:glycosyltransferase involved in cell wall biosynthesis
MKLSILIPYIRRHESFFHSLKTELAAQILPYAGQIEILSDDHEYDSIGTKRNRLLERATGKYISYFDADDKPSPDYIKLMMQAADSDCDCASLKGAYSVDGVYDGIFEHSIKYNEWKTNPEGSEIRYERFPNHLNMIRSSIAKQFKFPEKNHGEDFDWSTQLHNSGLLKTEHYIPEVIYYYNYISNK